MGVVVLICLARERHFGRCGLVVVGVAFWKKCVTVEVGFEILLLTTWKPVFFCLPLDQDVKLLALPPALCLPGHFFNNRLNL